MTAPKPSPFSPAEEDAIAAEVAEDLDAGVGAKHFEEIFDEVNFSSAAVEMDPGVRDRLERFKLEFAAGLNERLRGNAHKFACVAVNYDGHGSGFVCKFRDADWRLFTVEISYDEGFACAAAHGKEAMGRGMLALTVEKLIAAREKYMARMLGLH